MAIAATEPTQAAVALDAMLERRELRVARQRAWLARFGCPVVSLTLVNPGPVKDTPQARFLFGECEAAVDGAFASAGHRVLAREGDCFPTGPEGLRSVDADALGLKRLLVTLEHDHPLGRLWDADVIGPDGAAISRRQLGLPPRTCLACAQPAHACARAGTHALADLQRLILETIDAYRRTGC